MNYQIIQPPFSLQFREMPKRDLIAYAAWFRAAIPDRITELTKAVTSTLGYETWRSDAKPESLDDLSRWFEDQVETRQKNADEVASDRMSLPLPIEISDEDLTNRTFSLAIDIGMYFAQVVLKNLSGTRWDQVFGSKAFVDYGQPVIVGFGKVPLNPVAILVTTAYGVSRKRPARIRAIYDVWSRMKD